MSELDPKFVERILESAAPDGEASDAMVLADEFLERGDARNAARALDRAWGLAPRDPAVARARAAILDSLAVEEHGIRFRFVPAGPFLMGSTDGDPDERPVHVARTSDFWISETPMTWAAHCRILGWVPPPAGVPKDGGNFVLHEENKIRLQYCEGHATRAVDWHAHAGMFLGGGDGARGERASFRDDPDAAPDYDVKPMVAVSWQSAEELCARASTPASTWRLPAEAEWEKAARGGLIGCRYAWGDEPPDASRCDFGHFGEFRIDAPRSLPPNGYGLFGMCGGVWEWTNETYDALAYREARAKSPPPPGGGERVLRGGSWSDTAEACTVSFRMSRASLHWRDDAPWGGHNAPNIGYRVVRVESA